MRQARPLRAVAATAPVPSAALAQPLLNPRGTGTFRFTSCASGAGRGPVRHRLIRALPENSLADHWQCHGTLASRFLLRSKGVCPSLAQGTYCAVPHMKRSAKARVGARPRFFHDRRCCARRGAGPVAANPRLDALSARRVQVYSTCGSAVNISV